MNPYFTFFLISIRKADPAISRPEKSNNPGGGPGNRTEPEQDYLGTEPKRTGAFLSQGQKR